MPADMGQVFSFKQFDVDQQGCTMRINTDGVLLGAMADHPGPQRVLDIGTGTGVIALMLAQRFKTAAVDAVEIDPQAAAAAARNCRGSAFADRMEVFPTAFERFDPGLKYDLIVSNPPYFINDLRNAEKRKELARHTDMSFFDLLLRKCAGMMSAAGRLWLILPVKLAQEVVVNAVLQRLFPVRTIHVRSDAGKAPFRQMICLGFDNESPVEEEICIYAARGVYTAAYQSLLSEFFLAF